MTESCLFCRIVKGEISSDIVHRTEHTVAFRDISPQARVHVLVVPTEHMDNASFINHSHGHVIAEMFVAAREVAEQEGVDKSGYRLVVNVGDDALNSVPHLHMHVIGGRRMEWPPG